MVATAHTKREKLTITVHNIVPRLSTVRVVVIVLSLCWLCVLITEAGSPLLTVGIYFMQELPRQRGVVDIERILRSEDSMRELAA